MSRRGRGDGSVFKRADGRWVGVADLGRDSAGKRRRKVVYGESRREVEKALGVVLEKKDQGAAETGPRQTVATWLETWLTTWARPSVRPKTYLSYEWLMRQHAIPRIGRVRLDRLTPEHVQQLLTAAAEAGLSPRSCHHLRAVLRTALNRAIRAGHISRNVAALADPPRLGKARRIFLDKDGAAQLLAAAAGHPDETLIRLALGLGLRMGEALGLRWSDVDLEAGRLTVNHALQRVRHERRGKVSWEYELVPPKSATSQRELLVPAPILAALRAHKARQTERRLAKGHRWQDMDLVFCGEFGTPLDGSAATKRFQQLLVEAGMPRMRFHDLRHSCASLLLAEGVALRVIQDVLGHSTYQLTANTYSHVADALKRDAADAMTRALGG